MLVLLCCGQVAAQDVPLPAPLQQNVVQEVYPGTVTRIYGWAGEPRHLNPSREDPNGEISPTTQTFWQGQPFSPVLNGGANCPLCEDGAPMTVVCKDGEPDIIIITVMLDGKPEIVQQHVGADGTIDWDGVAGENNAAHDHWPNAFGIVTIENFDNAQDRVIVTGHTVTATTHFRPEQIEGNEDWEWFRPDQFGEIDMAAESVLVYSQQGQGGGAHDEDCLGLIQFPGLGEVNDVETIGANVGICETFVEFIQFAEYYQAIEDLFVDEDMELWLDFVEFLDGFGFTPDDFTERQVEWLLEWFSEL